MSYARWILFGSLYTLTSLFLQSAVFANVLPLYLVPQLVLLLIIFISFDEISPKGALLVFFLGLVIDVAAGGVIGPSPAAAVLIFGVLSLISDRIFIESGFAAFVVTLIAVCVYHLVYLSLVPVVDPALTNILTIALGQGAVTGLFASWFLSFFRKTLSTGSKRKDRL